MTEERVAAVREFNRLYTNVMGILAEGLLGTSYSLTEARVIFELAQREPTAKVADLRSQLGIDAGYLSRILGRFETGGLVSREWSSGDGRRRDVRLTKRGRETFKSLDKRSAEEIKSLLSTLDETDQRRLVGAMEAIREILESRHRRGLFLIRPPLSGDFGWVVQRHGALYAEEYDWDESFEALVARIVADYIDNRESKRQAAWIAEVDGERAGCVFCVKKDETTAQLRLMLVEPDVRGFGLGTRLVDECIRFARRARYEQMTLWTNDVLRDARRIYERAGFELSEENRHNSFGHDLVGQYWSLKL